MNIIKRNELANKNQAKSFKKTEEETYTDKNKLYLKKKLDLDAQRKINEICISLPQEKQKILFDFNNTNAAYSENKTLIDLFEEQVKNNPDKTALVFDNKQFTYQELNAKANQLAQYLRNKYAIKEDDLISIKLERSEWMIISILGVLKSGAAYVPVDPSLNEMRINYIVNDSKCKVLIDERELNKFKNKEKSYCIESVQKINKPQSLAYVIYTSGSTGNPKGVMIEHTGVVNRIEWMRKHYNFTSEDIILQKTTFAFDVSVWEIFMPLCFGAKMVLCTKEDVVSPQRIISLIKKEKITCIHFVPAMLNVFISYLSDYITLSDELKSLKYLFTSGEALSAETVKNWYNKLNVPLHNLYGPTEASIEVTYYATSKDDVKIPIGKPIWNTQIYIVDEQLNLLPASMLGEICISGIGVARGYLNKPELTNEKFISNPFVEGKKMYRTGDFGCWLTNGNIEYAGRKDDQVKIRGYRVELGEIENAIMQYSKVKECAVIAKNDAEENKILIAFAVVSSTLNIQETKNFLKTILPEYMVPSFIIEMEILPLNSNGKIDKKLLSQIDVKQFQYLQTYKEPVTKTEKLIAGIWKELLKLEKISIEDNFFDLGGHSLIAVKLMTQLQKETGVRLPLAILFQCPTIKQLAVKLNNYSRSCECLIPVKPSGSKIPVYIVHGVGGHILLLNKIVKYMHAEQPIYGLQPPGIGGNTKIPGTIEDIAAEYIKEVLQQNPAGPYALAGFSIGGIIAFEMAQQLKAMGKQVIMLALFDSYLHCTYYNDSALPKTLKRLLFSVMKKVNTIMLLTETPKSKILFEKRKMKEWLIKIYHRMVWLKKKKGEKKSHMYYIYKIQEQLMVAAQNYKPSVYNGIICLFRSKKRTFYYHDYKFLGWGPYAPKGIKIYEVEGEHEQLFAPPNDKKNAMILQKCLDNASIENRLQNLSLQKKSIIAAE